MSNKGNLYFSILAAVGTSPLLALPIIFGYLCKADPAAVSYQKIGVGLLIAAQIPLFFLLRYPVWIKLIGGLLLAYVGIASSIDFPPDLEDWKRLCAPVVQKDLGAGIGSLNLLMLCINLIFVAKSLVARLIRLI